MALKIKTALIMSSAILSAASLPGFAQTLNSGNGPRSDGNAKMRWVDEVAPRTLTTETRDNVTSDTVDSMLSDPGFTTQPSLAATGGDNLGSHVATQDLDMANNLIINVAAPVDIYDAANKSYVDAAAEGAKDNLGNHIATKVLQMSNFEITGLPSPLTPTSAANRAYVDTKVLAAKDNLGNHTATTALNMANFRIFALANPVNPTDGANKAYVDATALSAKDNLGNHTATMNLDMATKSIVNLANPVNASDAVNKSYVDGILDGAIDTITVEIDALKARKINTTAGILGGGDLSADRTLTFDTVWGDARYALAARNLTAGTGLTGGGTLAGDRSFALSGQALALHNLAVNGLIARTGTGAVGARSIIGATGGGITVTNGNAVAGHPTLAVDDSVVATLAGPQTFSGAKIFTSSPSVPTPVALSDAVNKGYVDTAIAGVKTDLTGLASRKINTVDGIKGGGDLTADRTLSFDTVWGDARYALSARTLTAGDGLTGGGDLTANRALAVDGTVVRTSGAQAIAGLKSFLNQTGTVIRQAATQDGITLLGRAGGTGDFDVTVTPGALTADRTLTLADGNTTLVAGTMVPTARSVATGTGLTGGGDFSANRTLAIDPAVVATLAGSQTFSGAKIFTLAPTVPTPTVNADAANKGYVDSTVSGAIAAAAYAAGDGLSLTGRTFAVDGTVVRTARLISTGTGLTGGGDLSANRAIGIDSTVVATLAGTQTFAGAKTFTLAPTVPTPVAGGDATNKTYVDAAISGAVSAAAYTAGDGMSLSGRVFSVNSSVVRTSGAQTIAGLKAFENTTGTTFRQAATQDGIALLGRAGGTGDFEVTLTPGALTADRTITLADGNTTLVAGTMVPTTRSFATGSGLTGGGDLSSNRTLAIDPAVVATLAGSQTFSGAKIFTLAPTVPTPTVNTDAANKGYVDSTVSGAVAAAAYAAGDGLALTGRTFSVDGSVVRTARLISTGSGLTGGGDLSANRTLGIDNTVVATLAGTQTFAGAKTFTLAPTVPAPVAGGDATNKTYVDGAISGAVSAAAYTAGDGMALSGRVFSVNASVVRTGGAQTIAGLKAFENTTGTSFRQAAAQDGVALLGRAGGTGGFEVAITPSTLTADRTLTLADGNTTLVAGIMVPTSRSVATGSGLTGGGDLSTNRTLAIDPAVVATLAGSQTFSGAKIFTLAPTVPTPTLNTDAANKGYVDSTVSGAIAAAAYAAGDGLALTGRTFSVDGSVVRTARLISTGSGLTGGGDLSVNRTLGIDNTVVATLAGTQTFAGAKTFTLAPTVPTPVAGGDATNKTYVDGAISGAVSAAAYTAGDGMTLSGRSFAVNSTVVRTSGAQSIAGAKSFEAPILLNGALNSISGSQISLTAPVLTANRTVTFADGNTVLVSGIMVPTTRSIAAGTGLSGGGDLSANRSLAIDPAIVATLAGAQTFSGAKSFTLPVVVAAPTLGTHAVNKDYLDTALANFTPPQNYSAGDGLTLTSGVFAADGTVLRSTGSYANPAWLTSLAGSKITGTVALANGGTGASTAAGARTALDVPSTGGVGATGTWAIGISGNAATATKLAAAKTISLSGDVSGSVSFDGAANAPITATLANSGVTAGTYGSGTTVPILTVDAKGRITAASVSSIGFPVTSVAGKTGAVTLASADITDATAANTASTIVERDASGNFSAGTITGALNGNAATSTKLAAAKTISLSGDVSGSVSFDGAANAPITATLANSGVTAGTYGSGTTVPSLTVDAKGRITAASATSIGFPVTSVSGKTGAVSLVSADITDATAANTASTIVERDASGNFSAGTITGALNGNAATATLAAGATRLATDRTINGVVFNGTSNINVPDLRGANGTVLIDGTGVTSGVNYVTLNNAATGGTVKLFTAGSDASVPLQIATKGTGVLTLGGSFDTTITGSAIWLRPGTSAFRIYDDTDNDFVHVNVPELNGTSYTLTLANDGNTTLTSGTMLATDDLLAAASTAVGAVKYNGTTPLTGAFHGGVTEPTSGVTSRLNYTGQFSANEFYARAYYYFSDRTLKKDIVAMEGMGSINELRPVSYAWKSDDRKALGLIAQEVEEVYPSAVSTDENGIKAVDYIQLIAPMLAAIQDLDARVKELEAH